MSTTAHLIDLENLVGSAQPTAHQVHATHDAYVSAIAHAVDDYWLLAMSHHCGRYAMLEWPRQSSTQKHGSGPDGADHQILKFLASPHATRRMNRIVIASGDGIFTEAATAQRELGREVVVASRPEALSRRLAAAADHVVLLEIDDAATDPMVLAEAA